MVRYYGNTLGMHERLQKIMLKLMFNEISNEWWGYYIIFQNFVEVLLFVSNYCCLLKVYILLVIIAHTKY
jgi:hypothetical protein